jgi:hypothetical protein
MLLVQLHEVDGGLDRILLRLIFELRVSPDYFLGLGERAIGNGDSPAREANVGAGCGWFEASAAEHSAGFDFFFGEFPDRIDKRLGRQPLFFRVYDHHHEFHRSISSVSLFCEPVSIDSIIALYLDDE